VHAHPALLQHAELNGDAGVPIPDANGAHDDHDQQAGPGSSTQERARRHAEQEEAAGRAHRDDARLGAELSAEERPLAETETVDSIKRAAENDGRV
jgi:hypothetical protein